MPARGIGRAQVTPGGGRKALVYPGSGVRSELLTPDLRRTLQMMWVVIPPGEGTGETPLVQEGEECGLVVQGELEILVGEGDELERHVLAAGDAIYRGRGVAHRSRNLGTTDAIVVVATTPPSV
ncbi:MAG: cupin domain-containing protein [Gaiella sp.]|nr:cupin domain-containing protein [Gaiella sp.]